MLSNQLTTLGLLSLLGQEDAPSQLAILGGHLFAAIVFSIVGVVVFFLVLMLLEKLTPFSIIKEIIEEHNTAVAIIVAAMVIGISLIIGAAIKG